MKLFLTITLGSVVWLALASTADGQLTLWYDVRPTLSEIDAPVPPYTNSASLSTHFPPCGQAYPLCNGGGRGDGQIIYLSPKIPDVTDYTGYGPPDGVPEHINSLYTACDWSRGDFHLYAEFIGTPGEVISTLGVTQEIPSTAFVSGVKKYFLQGVTTTLRNTWLWDSYSITGSDATTDYRLIQIPVSGNPPVFDPNQGLGAGETERIAQIHVETAYRMGAGPFPVAAYGVKLKVNDLLCTRVSDPGPAPDLPVNFGYDANCAAELGGPGNVQGTTSPTDDMVIMVVCKGDFDLDGQPATPLDDLAYFDIITYYNGTNCNPFELYLADFDCDGVPATGMDDLEYYKTKILYGACCYRDGDCFVRTPATACTGTSQGVGATCGPPNPCPMLVDPNCDGVFDSLDAIALGLALVNPAGYAAAYPTCNLAMADCNGDGSVNGLDVQTFLDLLFE